TNRLIVPDTKAGPLAASAPAVGAYAVRLPPFWAQHPEVWLLRAESSFPLTNILLKRHASATSRIHCPANSCQRRNWATVAHRHFSARCLLLGDRAATFDSRFLKELFLKRLSPFAQMILAAASDLYLPALAFYAYEIMERITHRQSPRLLAMKSQHCDRMCTIYNSSKAPSAFHKRASIGNPLSPGAPAVVLLRHTRTAALDLTNRGRSNSTVVAPAAFGYPT
ncbi:hypothetical protein HPB47_003726, partial [Ixodes persulcatus]